jgi:ribosomal protein L7/L12
LAAGRVIQAIKWYRTFTGAGLKESKDACDRMAAEPWADPGPAEGEAGPVAWEQGAGPVAHASRLPGDGRERVSELLFAGKKIHAIKVYRELTGVGLKEAKDAVEAMEKALRGTDALRFENAKPGGCLGMALVAAGVIGVAAAAVALGT